MRAKTIKMTLVLGCILGALLSVSVRASVEPGLAAHMERISKPQLLRVGERIHWALYYDYSNFGFIEGETSIIAIDCGWWPGATEKAMAELRKRTNKPVRYIIYTHGHADHLGGCSAIADRDAVEIYASDEYERYRDEMVSSRLLFIQRRATDQMGLLLPRGPEGSVGAGAGPGFYNGKAAYFPPTNLVPPDTDFVLDGVRIVLIPTPVDIDDAVSVYLPDERVLFPGDALIGVGPVVATPRQEKGRDPYLWMQSLDLLTKVPFDAVLSGHGPAYLDGNRGRLAMERARDTIQHIIDHVVRGLNAKVPREDIISSLRLPPELESDPDLGWYYHSLQWVARGVYTNFAGWYTDDIRDLFEIDPDDEARLLVQALGGTEAALAVAQKNMLAGEVDFAGRLLAQILRVAPQNPQVLNAAAEALEQGAYAESSSSRRNYMLMEAYTLRQRYDRSAARPFVDVLSLLRTVPTERLLANLTPRLKADTDPNIEKRLTLIISDRNEKYSLHIRRGVLRIVEGVEVPDSAQVAVHADDIVYFALGVPGARDTLTQGRSETSDIDAAAAADFFSHLE